jgi:hypothetical protein
MNESSTLIAPAADPSPPIDEYRSVSPLAVAALLTGLASAVALAHPLLSVVPLAAIVLAAVALRAIAAAARQVAGRGLAVAGLCLATLFLGWGLGGHFHHQATIRSQAREFTDDWLQILASGDLQRAHQLHVAREFRLDPQAQMQSVYQTNQEAGTSLMAFFHNPALERFRAAGPSVRYQFVEIALQSHDSLADEVVLKYQLQGPPEPVPFWITVRRTFTNHLRKSDWEIYAVSDEPPAL